MVLRQSSEEDFRIVVEGNGVIYLAAFEEIPQRMAQRHGPWIAGGGNVRRRKDASFEAGKIESLLRAKRLQLKRPRRKEFANNIGRAFVADLAVVRPMLQKKVFVLREKGSALGQSFIPNQCNPTAGPEYPYELPSGPFTVEPMRRLGCGNEVHAAPLEGCVFRRRANTPKIRIFHQKFLARLTHLLIGLNAEYGIPIFEQHLREDAGAESDVGDPALWSQAATRAQKLHDPIGISRAVADVVVDAVGKALGCIG